MPLSLPPAPFERLIVASGNPGKLREIRAMLAFSPGVPAFEAFGLTELGLPSPAETGTTFAANALLKARHAAAAWADNHGGELICALADDSGLEVDALNGAPGIFSARYATSDTGAADDHGATDDAANNAKLLAALRGVPAQRRCARYRCAMAFVRGACDPQPMIAEGVWEGRILETPRGHRGFGYDPYFWLPNLGRSAAELDPAGKNAASHRGKALRALLHLLRDESLRSEPLAAQTPS